MYEIRFLYERYESRDLSMYTYTYSDSPEKLGNELGTKVHGPSSSLSPESLFKPTEQTPQALLDSARSGVERIVEDLRKQQLNPAKTQVVIEAASSMRSAIEDALKEKNIKAVYKEKSLDAEGRKVTALIEARNTKPAQRAAPSDKKPEAVIDMRKPSAELKDAMAKAFTTHSVKESQAALQSRIDVLVQHIEKEASSAGKPVAVVVECPPRLTSMLESALDKKGLVSMHPSPLGPEQPPIRSANSEYGAEVRGLNAFRAALPDGGKGISDEAIRSVIAPRALQELGALPKDAMASKASELAQYNDVAVKKSEIQEITRPDSDRFNRDAYLSKYEKDGHPKDMAVGIWVGSPSNVVLSFGGTSADMARGVDRVQQYLEAKGFEASPKEIKTALNKQTLEKIGREGLDDRMFDRIRSDINAAASEKGAPPLKPLQVMHLMQQAQNPKMNANTVIKAVDGTTLGTLREVRNRVAELQQERVQPPLVASLVQLEALKKEAGQLATAAVAASERLNQMEVAGGLKAPQEARALPAELKQQLQTAPSAETLNKALAHLHQEQGKEPAMGGAQDTFVSGNATNGPRQSTSQQSAQGPRTPAGLRDQSGGAWGQFARDRGENKTRSAEKEMERG